MLIEFAVTNFRSIREKQFLSMLPSARVRAATNEQRLLKHSCYSNLPVLGTAVIYGANASGKSNMLSALELLKVMVEEGHNATLGEGVVKYNPFRMQQPAHLPTDFEIRFIAKDKLLYEYFLSFNAKEIVYEALYCYPKSRKVKLFERQHGHPISFGKYFKGEKKSIEIHTLPNQLFLSKAANNNLEQLKEVYLFFKKHLRTYISHKTLYDEQLLSGIAKYMANNPDSNFTHNLTMLVSHADTGIVELIGQKIPHETDHFFESADLYTIKTVHKVIQLEEDRTENLLFDLREESAGTRKLIALGGLIMRVLDAGDVLVIDELDKSMHTHLTKTLIKLFHSTESNPNKAQLIFATHDASLLGEGLFRFDQINLSEKMEDGATEISVVSDIPDLKQDFPLLEWYLTGKFGGTPLINEADMEFTFRKEQ
ncbi:ATP-binding protein [Limibacter armeniacum]|uniref:AAA family ATPase n=1 Tax=Limibacter armeniacum TaxID=466084 RepID=UPI002FE61D0E